MINGKEIKKIAILMISIVSVIISLFFTFESQKTNKPVEVSQKNLLIQHNDSLSEDCFLSEKALYEDGVKCSRSENKLKNLILERPIMKDNLSGDVKKYILGFSDTDLKDIPSYEKKVLDVLLKIKQQTKDLQTNSISITIKEDGKYQEIKIRPLYHKKTIDNLNEILMNERKINKIYNNIVNKINSEYKELDKVTIDINKDITKQAQEYSKKEFEYLKNNEEIINKIEQFKDGNWFLNNEKININKEMFDSLNLDNDVTGFFYTLPKIVSLNDYLTRILNSDNIEKILLNESGFVDGAIVKEMNYEQMNNQSSFSTYIQFNVLEFDEKVFEEDKKLFNRYVDPTGSDDYLKSLKSRIDKVKSISQDICDKELNKDLNSVEDLVKTQYKKVAFSCDKKIQDQEFILNNKEKINKRAKNMVIPEIKIGGNGENESYPNQLLRPLIRSLKKISRKKLTPKTKKEVYLNLDKERLLEEYYKERSENEYPYGSCSKIGSNENPPTPRQTDLCLNIIDALEIEYNIKLNKLEEKDAWEW